MLWIVNWIPNYKLTESNPTNSTERLMQPFCGIPSLHCYLLNWKSSEITAHRWEGNLVTFGIRTIFNHWPLKLKKWGVYTILSFKWTWNGELCINDGWDLHWISLPQRVTLLFMWLQFCNCMRQWIILSLLLLHRQNRRSNQMVTINPICHQGIK